MPPPPGRGLLNDQAAGRGGEGGGLPLSLFWMLKRIYLKLRSRGMMLQRPAMKFPCSDRAPAEGGGDFKSFFRILVYFLKIVARYLKPGGFQLVSSLFFCVCCCNIIYGGIPPSIRIGAVIRPDNHPARRTRYFESITSLMWPLSATKDSGHETLITAAR